MVTTSLRNERKILWLRIIAALVFTFTATFLMKSFIGVAILWSGMAIRKAWEVRTLKAELEELTAPRAKLLTR